MEMIDGKKYHNFVSMEDEGEPDVYLPTAEETAYHQGNTVCEHGVDMLVEATCRECVGWEMDEAFYGGK